MKRSLLFQPDIRTTEEQAEGMAPLKFKVLRTVTMYFSILDLRFNPSSQFGQYSEQPMQPDIIMEMDLLSKLAPSQESLNESHEELLDLDL
jgi:hypothetical protein